MSSADSDRPEPPALSVIVVATKPPESIRDCLESLAAQTMAPAHFEIVVVGAAADEDLQGLVADFAATHPGLRLRLSTLSGVTPGSARNVGLRAARGEYSLIVEPGEPIGTDLLTALRGSIAPGVVPVASRGHRTPMESSEVLLHALAAGGGKLVPTRVARKVRYRDGLGTWMEFSYCLELVDQEGLTFLAPDSDTPVEGPRGAEIPNDFATRVVEPLALIQHLRKMGPMTGAGQDLAERMVAHQATRIRDFLLLNPDAHADVVAEVRRRRIPDMPWALVNEGRARHLALLYLFPPFLDTSALVAARRLRERGWVTDVVSQDVSNLRTEDPSSRLVAEEILDESRVLPGRPQINDWGSVVEFTERALIEIETLESAKGPYETVYSRAMAAPSHFAAAVRKLRAPGIRWVAEFSDPLSRNAYGEIRVGDLTDGWLVAELAAGLRDAGHELPGTNSFWEWAEHICYALADEIIFTNQHQLDFMLGYSGDREVAQRAARISHVSHHPVPSPDLYTAAESRYPLGQDKVHIGYFGNFYANRGLSDITEAFDRLSPKQREKLHLHVFTSDPERLVLDTLELGRADVVSVNPMLGFLEYLNLTTRFDVLLITDFATRPHYVPNPYLPAKLSDYLGSGSQIWAVQEPGSVLSTFEVAYSSEVGDLRSSVEVLRALASSRGVVELPGIEPGS